MNGWMDGCPERSAQDSPGNNLAVRIPKYLRQVRTRPREQAKPQPERSGDFFLVRHPNRIAYANAVALDILALPTKY